MSNTLRPLSSLASKLGISAGSLLRVYTIDSMSRAKWLMVKLAAGDSVSHHTHEQAGCHQTRGHVNNAAKSGIDFLLGEAGKSQIYGLNL